MYRNIFIALILFVVPVSSYATKVTEKSEIAGVEVFVERSPFWESISTSRIVVSTSYGLELIGVDKINGGLSKVSTASGSGFSPIELDVVSGKYALVLTNKTLDFYTIHNDSVHYQSSVQLRKEDPTDLSFRDTDMLLVTYKTGFETFHVNYKGNYVNKIESGLVTFSGETN